MVMSYVQPRVEDEFIINLSETNGRCVLILYGEFYEEYSSLFIESI